MDPDMFRGVYTALIVVGLLLVGTALSIGIILGVVLW